MNLDKFAELFKARIKPIPGQMGLFDKPTAPKEAKKPAVTMPPSKIGMDENGHEKAADWHAQAGKKAGDRSAKLGHGAAAEGHRFAKDAKELDSSSLHERAAETFKEAAGHFKAAGAPLEVSNHYTQQADHHAGQAKDAKARQDAAFRARQDATREAATSKPPPGFAPIKGSKKGGYFKMQGGKRVYWYPDKGGKPAAKTKKAPRLVVPKDAGGLEGWKKYKSNNYIVRESPSGNVRINDTGRPGQARYQVLTKDPSGRQPFRLEDSILSHEASSLKDAARVALLDEAAVTRQAKEPAKEAAKPPAREEPTKPEKPPGRIGEVPGPERAEAKPEKKESESQLSENQSSVLSLAKELGFSAEVADSDNVVIGGPIARMRSPRSGEGKADFKITISADRAKKIIEKNKDLFKPKANFLQEMARRRRLELHVSGNTFPYKEEIKAAGGVWSREDKRWLMPDWGTVEKMQNMVNKGE